MPSQSFQNGKILGWFFEQLYKGKPKEHQIEGLVDEFKVNQEFVCEAV
jgi:hypothetical protein